MRRASILLGAISGVLANPLPDGNDKTPNGIGTGVTAIIAPPGGSPAGCLTNFNGEFGIAAVNISSFKELFVADPTGAKANIMPGVGKMMAFNMLMGNAPAPAPAPARAVDMAPKVTNVARLFGFAKAAAEIESTITVRSTRTHYRTVTMANRASGKPAVYVAPSKPTPESGAAQFKAGGKIKAAIMYQIGDGQVQAGTKAVPIPLPSPKPTNGAFSPLPTGAPRISQIGDGQIQAPTGKGGAAPARVSQIADGQIQAPVKPARGGAPKGASGGMGVMAGMNMKRAAGAANFCAGGKPVRMKLVNGVLKDSSGRTGYIADNRQFQFDGPPQAGAQLTAGYSLCKSGDAAVLALGQSTEWWQCLSGEFYNLYDKNIAAQCNAVKFIILDANDCSALDL